MKQPTKLLSIRVAPELLAKINELAARWQLSREATIRAMLAEALSADGERVSAGIRAQKAKPDRFTSSTTERRRRRGPSKIGKRWRRKDRPEFDAQPTTKGKSASTLTRGKGAKKKAKAARTTRNQRKKLR